MNVQILVVLKDRLMMLDRFPYPARSSSLILALREKDFRA